MVRKVDRQYLTDLVKQNYCDQELNCFFVEKIIINFSKFSTLNSDALVWKITYYKNNPSILTIFPVHEK